MVPRTYTLQAHPVVGINVPVELEALECSNCEERIETPYLIKKNSAKISKSKLSWLSKQTGNTYISALIKELRKSTGLTQQEFSSLTGATGTAISKYELGTVKPSAMAEKLFLLMARRPETIDALRDMSDDTSIFPNHRISLASSATALTCMINHLQVSRSESAPIYPAIYDFKEHEEKQRTYEVFINRDGKISASPPVKHHTTFTNIGLQFLPSQAVH